jgi:hypothetical protein
MPPSDASIRMPIHAVITDVARDFLLADVNNETWRFRAGTGLLLRREGLLEVDGTFIAPDAAIVRIYPPQTRTPLYTAWLMSQILGSQTGEGRKL